MSKDITLRRSYYYREEESAKLSAYVKQQKLIKQLKKLYFKEAVLEELTDKLLDANDASIHRIYDQVMKDGIEKGWEAVAKLRTSKNKT